MVQTALLASKAGIVIKEDSYLMEIQNLLGIGISALGEAFLDVLKNKMDKNFPIDFEKINILLGETRRILADVYHGISLSRSVCIIQNLRLTAKNAIENSKIGSFFFGQEFTDTLKDSVAMEKSAKELIKPSQHMLRKFPPRQNQQDGQRDEFLNSKAPWKETEFQKNHLSSSSSPSTSQLFLSLHPSAQLSALQTSSLLNVKKVNFMAGILAEHVDNWFNLTSDQTVLNAVSGYRVPFIHPPFQLAFPNVSRLSPRDHLDCFNEINNLLNKRIISPCTPTEDQFLSSFFLADKPNGIKGFILNLKALNKFIIAPHFKLEDLKKVLRLVSKSCWMATIIDFQDAYFTINIDKNYKNFLRFIFEDTVYEFNCLPFG